LGCVCELYLREIEREWLGRFHFLSLLEFLGWFLRWHGLSPSGGLRRWVPALLYANRGPNVQTKESGYYVRANVRDTMAGRDRGDGRSMLNKSTWREKVNFA